MVNVPAVIDPELDSGEATNVEATMVKDLGTVFGQDGADGADLHDPGRDDGDPPDGCGSGRREITSVRSCRLRAR
jgi:hypothetical protein